MAADVQDRTINEIYELQFEYLMMNDVMKLIKEEKLTVLTQNFDNSCSIKIEVRKASLNMILGKLENIEGLVIKYLRTT